MAYAGFWRRVSAVVIDTFILVILMSLLFGHLPGGSEQITFMDFIRGAVEPVYTVLFWYFLTGTPGKLLMGCHVVDADTGNSVTIKQAVLRYLGYYVSIFSMGVGFLWVVWDKRKQGFHDKIANTVVQYCELADRYDESRKSLQQLISELR